MKADSDSGNEHTHSKYQTAAKNIELWAHSNHLVRLSQITPDALDHWKSLWSPKAKNPNDRIGKTTAGRRLEKVKRFFNYCVKMHWLAANPAAELKANKPDPSVTWPLLSGRYEKVIAATYEYDKRARRPSDQFGADMRAIIELMRWTGSNAVREYDPRVGSGQKPPSLSMESTEAVPPAPAFPTPSGNPFEIATGPTTGCCLFWIVSLGYCYFFLICFCWGRLQD